MSCLYFSISLYDLSAAVERILLLSVKGFETRMKVCLVSFSKTIEVKRGERETDSSELL